MFLNIEVSVAVAMSYVNGVDACGDDLRCFLPEHFGISDQATRNRRVQDYVLKITCLVDDDECLRESTKRWM